MKNRANFCRAIIIAVLSDEAGFNFEIHPKFSEATIKEIIALYRASNHRRVMLPQINWINIVKYSDINPALFNANEIQSIYAICVQINTNNSSQWFIFDAKTLNITSK